MRPCKLEVTLGDNPYQGRGFAYALLQSGTSVSEIIDVINRCIMNKQETDENEKMYSHSSWKRHGGNYCQSLYTIWRRIRINILDITQTIVQGYFNMMMIVDVSKADQRISAGELQMNWKNWKRKSELRSAASREEIFEKMHRL